MRIIVLFNLKPGTDRAEYERWARETDTPTVNGLQSIDSFTVHEVTGVLGSDAPAPFQFVEVIDVGDMAAFGADVATETMQRVAAEFQAFADNPIFLTTRPLGGGE